MHKRDTIFNSQKLNQHAPCPRLRLEFERVKWITKRGAAAPFSSPFQAAEELSLRRLDRFHFSVEQCLEILEQIDDVRAKRENRGCEFFVRNSVALGELGERNDL